MDALRTGVSALAAFDSDVNDNSTEATTRKAIRLTAMGPTIVTAHHRLRQGLEPVAPDPSLNHAGNFLNMLFGEKPDQETVNLLDVDFILHAEHGGHASSFGARVLCLDFIRPSFGGYLGHWGSQRPLARRCGGRSDENGPGHRSAGERRGVCPETTGWWRPHYGFRTPGVQGGGPEGAAPERALPGLEREDGATRMVPDSHLPGG